ncbi:SOS response-associated peptidase [Halobacillus sp. ACCC02827]|uniref:SOS response-associated peptidase n=1 Tax=Bacillaceae TaxID=186817 RepID=UPI0002A509DE|nr:MULTISPECIES: SOS response-associated peptidase [Bacillaceae]ELK48915.1 hypothetical protein D479_01440 [Halobacillus sp. BAB-2008]QHT45758.1 SOS response-associated peptidase [Bacillus sp. SB49]WJE16558.1 SOS response-associated peptidase [Halobacillus sp. ACCC02827]
MCGRYTLLADESEIRKEFGITRPIPDYQIRYNIAPGQKVLAVIHDGSEKRAGYMKWGLVPSWAKDERIGYKMINARSETAHEKPSFQKLIQERRCLLLADSFYEWKQTEDGKQPMRISRKDGRVFAFAGLWDKWGKGDGDLFTCSILTKEADAFMNPIHHRMPVILSRETSQNWLDPHRWTKEQAQAFIQKVESADMEAYPVSDYVNKAGNEGEACIQPLA